MFQTQGFIYRKKVVCTGVVEFVSACKQIISYCKYNGLPEDEPSGLKHVADIVKIKILVQER